MANDDCERCNGSGKVPCEGCRNKDNIIERREYGYSNCARCHGTRELPCPHCNGRGKKQ